MFLSLTPLFDLLHLIGNHLESRERHNTMHIVKLWLLVFAFTGCAALRTLPLTTPIWLLIGLAFLINPGIRTLWFGCSIVHIVLFVNIALLGLAISDNFWLDTPSSKMYYDSLSLFVMGTLSTVLTSIAVLFASPKSRAEPDYRFVLLQMLIAVAAFAYVLNLMRTYPWS
jgi:hypothetical protein